MNIKQLEYFVDLSETLNFTKTAQNFYISQTAITKQIQCLEDDLGIPLFHRTKKCVSLTSEGRSYLPYAKKILEDIDLSYKVIEEYQKGNQGSISIGFIKSLDDELLLKLLQKIKEAGLVPMVVTGSGQRSLLDRLEHNFPNTFHPELMVTAFDVKHGKPHPEPYLMALEKGGFNANEAVVIENAPLGVQAGIAAGIFTIAVNTGPLDNKVLLDAGANALYPSMQALCDGWTTFTNSLQGNKEADKKRK